MNAQVVTLGESMLRLAAPPGRALEQTDTLALDVAGAESNVAIGLARLGIQTRWVSCLVNNPPGRRIANTLRAQGVDVSYIVWTDAGRVGLYFIEPGTPPRAGQIIYDRADSAFARLTPDQVDWRALDGARILHLTGITPALSANGRAIILRAMDEADARGVAVSFDVNYRARLWTPAEACEFLTPILPRADILFCGQRDAGTLFGIEGDAEQVLDKFAARLSNRVVIITDGANGAVARANGVTVRGEAISAQVVDRIGSGDAFDAGFICGYLEKGEGDEAALATGLRFGVLNAALKLTFYGDINWTTRADLEQHLDGIALRTWR